VRAARFSLAVPVQGMVYYVVLGERSLALKAEARIKKLPRVRKLRIIADAMSRKQLLEFLALQEN
jgi:predicted GIY-YIG superfamily endonuclease